jgi:hypothetical protein
MLNSCGKCSEKQKDGSGRIIKFLQEKKPEQWNTLLAKYDPEGVYLKKYKEDTEPKAIV